MSDKQAALLLSLITYHLSLDLLVKIDQFDGRHRGLEPLVPRLDPRAVNGLLQSVGGDDAVERRARPSPSPTCAMPFVTSPATYSKCGVCPRMTVPRQITASKRPDCATVCASERNLERARHAEVLDRRPRPRRAVRARPARPRPAAPSGSRSSGSTRARSESPRRSNAPDASQAATVFLYFSESRGS